MVRRGGSMDADAGRWLSLGRKAAWAEEKKNQTNKEGGKKRNRKKIDGTSCNILPENEPLRDQGL